MKINQKKIKETLIKVFNYWLPPIIWGTIIFSFSSLHTISTTDFYLGDFLIKKTAHIMEYGIFATLLYRALVNSNIKKENAMWISILIAFSYGMTDEFHQSFTPGRTPTVRDVLIDTAGASIFIYGIIGNIKKMPKIIQNLYNRYQISN